MVLFDAVSQTFEQNGVFGAIDELYRGTSDDFVKCETCGYVSSRPTKFYNLSLPIQDPFEGIKNEDVI